MVTRACRQFDIAQLLQLPPHGRFCQRDAKLIIEPTRQVDQPPADNPVDRWDRAAFNDLCKSLALGIVQQRGLARRLPIEETVWTLGIEPNHPVAHDLQRHSADACGIAAACAIINFRQCQQPSSLVRAPCRTSHASQAHCVKVVPQSNRCTHRHALQQEAIDSEIQRLGNPPRESASMEVGITPCTG